jgi:type VI secretion system protein ImpM
MVGVLMPSIDRVGRYFPLTVAQTLDIDQSLAAVIGSPELWFEQVEALMLSTLEENADFSAFDHSVSALGFLPTTDREPASRFTKRTELNDSEIRLRALADMTCEGSSLWWEKGSARASGLTRYQGLPDAAKFASFLLGQGASI